MKDLQEFKKQVLDELIRTKQEEHDLLKRDQEARLEGANRQETDEQGTYESPMEEQMREIKQETAVIDNLAEDLRVLKQLDAEARHEEVDKGALVHTNRGWFFIAVYQPTVEVAGEKVMGISPDSPLYQKMEGCTAPAEVQLNQRSFQIAQVA